MNIKTISAHYERKHNLGDFSSVTSGVTIWADIDEDEDAVACIDELKAVAKEAVKEEILAATGKNGRTAMQFMGKPIEEGDNAD